MERNLASVSDEEKNICPLNLTLCGNKYLVADLLLHTSSCLVLFFCFFDRQNTINHLSSSTIVSTEIKQESVFPYLFIFFVSVDN